MHMVTLLQEEHHRYGVRLGNNHQQPINKELHIQEGTLEDRTTQTFSPLDHHIFLIHGQPKRSVESCLNIGQEVKKVNQREVLTTNYLIKVTGTNIGEIMSKRTSGDLCLNL